MPEMEWDGHVKFHGRASFPPSGTALDAVSRGSQVHSDGLIELRFNHTAFLSDMVFTEINWEAGFGGGDTRRNGQALRERFPDFFPRGLFNPPNDDRRFADLTWAVHEGDTTMAFHRLDRAFVAFTPSWGEVRLGRQAVTWGHGFTFNPMDLFNPFAPADLERDYKTGDDMVLVRLPFKSMEFEWVYVARRESDTGSRDPNEHSMGAKTHLAMDGAELDLILIRHFQDWVAGMGVAGYIKNAAWRFDLTGTFLDDASQGQSFYVSAVANVDYSWTWLGKNWYGFFELYYNGLSRDNFQDQYGDPAVNARMDRGELFVLGSLYASGQIHLEVHPLVNCYFSPIVNLRDGSFLLLPRMVYDLAQNLQLTLSGSFGFGKNGTEYGGYALPGAAFKSQAPDTVLAWLTWYF